MPGSVVQVNSAAQNTAASPGTATLSSGATAGNTIVVVYGGDDYVTAGNKPTGFTEPTGGRQETFLGHYVWYKVAAGGETSFQFTPNAAATFAWIALEISGVGTLDISNGSLNATGANTYTTPSVVASAGARFAVASIGGSANIAFNTGMGAWTNSYVERADVATTLGSGTRDNIGVATLSFTADGVTGTSTGVTWDGAVSPQSRTAIILVFQETVAATAVPYNPQRSVLLRDTGEVPWIQRDRRNANLVATAANPLVSPLDSAYQASARYWHLYGDTADAGPRTWQSLQRNYVSDLALLAGSPADPLLVGGGVGGAAWRRTAVADFTDRREVPQQRAYVSEPGLLSTALLEDVLLGSADDLRRRQLEAATHYDRREVPQQRERESDPSLGQAPASDPLLGLPDARRYLTPATHEDRRQTVPPRLVFADIDAVSIVGTGALGAWWGVDDTAHFLYNRARVSDPSLLTPPPSTPLDPTTAAWTVLWQMYNQAAVHVDRREVPQQRPYLSDPSFYPTAPPTDPLTLAWGAGGHYWLLYNTAALLVDRREVPQQREYESDPALYAIAADPLLVGAGVGGDTWRRVNAAAYYDRRETAAQPRRWTVYFDAGPGTPPLTLSWGAGGTLWHRYHRAADIVDRVWQPQQRLRLAALELLATITPFNATSTPGVAGRRTSTSGASASRTSTPGVAGTRTSTPDVSDG